MTDLRMTEIEETLAMLADDDLSTVERLILSSTGTVQDLLSVIFGTPARVEVISQLNYDTVLVRWAKLVIDNPDPMTVALAESVIPYEKNDTALIGMMGDRDIGIGYAINSLGIPTERHLLGIHVDGDTFARSYQIRGDAINILITESFSREMYASFQKP
jgi:hypothetical protein